MNFPHCQKSISFFAPAVMGPAKRGAPRLCPHCQGKFVINGDKKLALITAATTAVLGFFLLRPIPVVGLVLWGMVPVLVTFIVAARLKKFER